MTQNEISHYESLKKQDTANRKLIKKLQLDKQALKEQLILSGVSSSYAVQKVHFYSMISTYLKASEEVENGIYDPIEDALQEIQQKYLIIQKA